MSIESLISQNEETVSSNFIVVIFICINWNDVFAGTTNFAEE